MMWLRQKVMTWLVYVMWHRLCSPALHAWCRDTHSSLLKSQMAARRAAGQVEVRTGVYSMTEKELDEHANRF